MGCFNVRCGYSGTEVHSEDEVHLFFIVNNGFGNGNIGFRCYPQDCYTLLGPGIPARYNEYGWYEFDESLIISEYLQKVITKKIIPLTEEQCDRDRGGKKEYMAELRGVFNEEGKETKPRPLVPWDVIGDMIHDGELFVRNPYAHYSPEDPVRQHVGMFPVHKHFIDEFIASNMKSGWGKNARLVRDEVSEAVDKQRKVFDMTLINELEGIDYSDLTPEQKTTLREYFKSEMGDNDDLRMEQMEDLGALYRVAKYKTDDDREIPKDELVDMYVILKTMQSKMSAYGLEYKPQAPGHQCYNFNSDIAYHESVLAFVKKQQLDWHTENGEDIHGNPLDE